VNATIDRKLEADLQTNIDLVGQGETVTMQFQTWRQKESGNYERTAVKVKLSRWAISRLLEDEAARINREVARLTQEMQP
jgi:hypothetical protein